MGSNVDYKIDKISDYLYRKRGKLAKTISVNGRRRAFDFELTMSASDYVTVTVNSNRTYIMGMPRESLLPEDEALSYVKDMPFSEKMAFIDAWGELKMRLNRKMFRDGNLGLSFGAGDEKKGSAAKKQ